jgi:chromosome segregation ATPase
MSFGPGAGPAGDNSLQNNKQFREA